MEPAQFGIVFVIVLLGSMVVMVISEIKTNLEYIESKKIECCTRHQWVTSGDGNGVDELMCSVCGFKPNE